MTRTERVARLIGALFWWRRGRELDLDDGHDLLELWTITSWPERGARLPGESIAETANRASIARTLRPYTEVPR